MTFDSKTALTGVVYANSTLNFNMLFFLFLMYRDFVQLYDPELCFQVLMIKDCASFTGQNYKQF